MTDRSTYMMNGPCPECEIYGVGFGDDDDYVCDECGSRFEADDLDQGITGERVNLDDDQFPDALFEEDDEPDPTADMTPMQKSKSHMANACFAVGILFCITIIGIPIGLLFMVVSAAIEPDIHDVEEDAKSA